VEPIRTKEWGTLSEFLRETARKVALLEAGSIRLTEHDLATCAAKISEAIADAFIPKGGAEDTGP
jgi:hypothetical protein